MQRSACPDPPSSPAAHLAALIYKQASGAQLPTAPEQERNATLGDTDASGPATLIWVEDTAAQASPGTAAARGIIVAAHRRCETFAGRSFIICFPIEAGIPIPQLPAVLRLLEGLGWSLLTRRRTGTASGCARVAVLVNAARPGTEQRLWLSESIPAVRSRAPRDRRDAVAPHKASNKPAVMHDSPLELRRRAMANFTEGRVTLSAGE